MKTALCAAVIGATMLIGSGLPASSAPPGYIVTLEQVGSDVVATGGGAIDLTGLSFLTPDTVFAVISPAIGAIDTGLASSVPIDVYNTIIGPSSFGGGGQTSASSGSGDMVGIFVGLGSGNLIVPSGYVSDSALSDTSTYTGQTFSSLGVTPGVYEWKWGPGANQTFTLDIAAGAVPEPSTWAMILLGFASLGFAGYRRGKATLAA
jgi:hypothetical protein